MASTKVKDWTDGRIKSFITTVLRGGMRRWPPKWEVLQSAYVERRKNPASGKLAKFYQCSSCKSDYTSTQVQVDHIEPAVDPIKGFTTWDEFIERLFVPATGMQVLCKPCHKIKTKKETKARNANK